MGRKNLITVLAVLMMLSLNACGSSETIEKSNADNQLKTENQTKLNETVSSVEKENEPSFDTGWAGNEFEAMIPELPFKGWTVNNQTDTVYEIEVGGLSTANGADTSTGYEQDKDSLIRYINSLPSYGFTVEETGENYSWLVTDQLGNTIEFICGDGYCWVTFTKAD